MNENREQDDSPFPFHFIQSPFLLQNPPEGLGITWTNPFINFQPELAVDLQGVQQLFNQLEFFLQQIPKKKKPCASQIMKKINFKKCDIEAQCSICYNKLNKKSKIPQLECGHIFHKKCLSEWIKRKNNCPLCRNQIV